MSIGAKENYEARKAADKAKHEAEKNKRWWFNQRVPIDRFTGWLVAWTFLLFIATIGSAGILWKTDNTLHETLTETKKAAEAAEVSANAAKAAVELSDKTAERQLRSYINIEKIDLTWAKGVASAQIGIRNAGQTPAGNLVFRGLIATNEDVSQAGKLPAYFGDSPANFIIGDEDTSKVTRILGQGREESYTVTFSPPSQLKMPKVKPRFPVRLYIIGAVYYLDIFGKPRHTRFCVYYLTADTRGYCTEHNDAN